MISYTSFGAARQVTGSSHLFKINDYHLLMDCGLDYEKDENGYPKSNKDFSFNPAKIDALILSHAHIDHSGNIPNLIRQGFTGTIYCTKATAMLVTDLWNDSLNIQKSDSRKKNNRKGMATEVLYSERHIELAGRQLRVVAYNEEISITNEIAFQFYQAGHIPGAASVKLSVNDKGNKVNIGFSGDLGNFNSALVKDPEPIKGLDYFLSESTYGGRNHTHEKDRMEAIFDHVKETCIQNRGKLVIPAFSIGRTQAILFTFHQLYRAGKLPSWLNIYTDSPLAIRSTRVYDHCLQDLNKEAQDFHQLHGDLFQFDNLRTVTEAAQSDYISQSYEPCVIVSAAGMLEGGRIQKHIRNNVSIENNKILIAGFCSEGTLGARLLAGQTTININKKDRVVKADINRTDALSAHADTQGLLNYYEGMDLNKVKKLFFVHGDEENMVKLQDKVNAQFPKVKTILPEKGEEFLLN
jgi:metallo-beta-lactamase family protein